MPLKMRVLCRPVIDAILYEVYNSMFIIIMNNRLLENDSGSFSSRSQRRLSCYGIITLC